MDRKDSEPSSSRPTSRSRKASQASQSTSKNKSEPKSKVAATGSPQVQDPSIKSLTIEKNMIKESITKTGEKVQTDVAAEIFIEKHPLTDELDVDMVLTIDPKSEKPMNVNVEAELVSEEATVTGTATGKDKGKAVIETEVHHSDYYEKNHKSATDSKDITLDLTKKNKASDAHDLDATADDVDLKKEKKKKGSK